MSRVHDYLHAINDEQHKFPPAVVSLLREIWVAWLVAETDFASEAESRRWSRVCTAAEQVVGIE